MRFMIALSGGFICTVSTLVYFYYDWFGIPQPLFEEYVSLMLMGISVISMGNAINDGTENNQIHISKQLVDTYNMAKKAEATSSRLLQGIRDMQEMYNDQITRIVTNNNRTNEHDESSQGGDLGNDQ